MNIFHFNLKKKIPENNEKKLLFNYFSVKKQNYYESVKLLLNNKIVLKELINKQCHNNNKPVYNVNK